MNACCKSEVRGRGSISYPSSAEYIAEILQNYASAVSCSRKYWDSKTHSCSCETKVKNVQKCIVATSSLNKYETYKWSVETLALSFLEVVLVSHTVLQSDACCPYRETKWRLLILSWQEVGILPIPCYEVILVAHIVTRSGACCPYRDMKWCLLTLSWHEVVLVDLIVTQSGACWPYRDMKWCLLTLSWHNEVLVDLTVTRSGACWPYRDNKWCLLTLPWHEVVPVDFIVTISSACCSCDTKRCLLPKWWHEMMQINFLITLRIYVAPKVNIFCSIAEIIAHPSERKKPFRLECL
jgi:hypothetical protein